MKPMKHNLFFSVSYLPLASDGLGPWATNAPRLMRKLVPPLVWALCDVACGWPRACVCCRTGMASSTTTT
jgi:hypothetical protein